MPTLPPEGASPHVLAIDVGGTKLAVGVVAHDGTLVDTVRSPTHVHEGPAAVLARIERLAGELLARHAALIDRVGVGCGGPLDTERGLIQNPPNLPGWFDVPIVARFEQAFGLPVTLENDANAAALAEYHYGAGRGARHMLYLTLSTGIGGGLILGGELYRGKRGNAGELGHIQVKYDGETCNCGGRGCLEHYASGTNLARRARALAEAHPDSLLARLEPTPRDITARTVLAALNARDPLALALWDDTLDLLAAGIASAVHAFDPERVVLGGGITNFGTWLFEPLRERLAARAMPLLASGVTVVPAELGEHVGVLGAAAVAFLAPVKVAA